MKKLMTMIAAVATAFGLYAADTADIAGINSFEDGNDAGVVGKKFTPANAEGWSFSGTETELDLDEYAGDEYTYPTTTVAGNVRRTEFPGSVNDQFLKLETGKEVLSLATKTTSIFADQVVKFTGFEEAPPLADNTKIAVWMSEEWNDDDTVAETNLYVSAYNAEEGVTNYLVGAANQYKLGKWYRLTIKSLGNIMSGSYAARLGFVVYIDGEMVVSDEAKTAIDVDTLKDDATKALAAAGQLFPAITENTTFASVGYMGIGSVDDVVVDDQGPEFARKIPFTVTGNAMLAADTIKDSEGNDVDPASGVANGTTVIVTWKAKAGYKILGDKKTTSMTIDGQGKTIEPGEDIIAAEVVAKLNDTTDLAESELANALAALNEGDVIATVKACSVYTDDDEPATIWAFTPNTTITGTETGLAIVVGSYENEEETVAGSLAFNGAVAASETLAISFDEELEGDLTFGGTVAGALEVANGTMIVAANITLADGASIKAAAFNFDDYVTTITLQEGAEVKATDDKIAAIVADDDLELQVSEKGEDEYYTYTAVEPAPDYAATVTVNGSNPQSFETLDAAFAYVQANEATATTIDVYFLKDTGDYVPVAGKKLNLKAGASAGITPSAGLWEIKGTEGDAAVIESDIDAGKALTFQANLEVTYKGTVNGTLVAPITTATGIALGATGSITAGASGLKFEVPEGYRLVENECVYTAVELATWTVVLAPVEQTQVKTFDANPKEVREDAESKTITLTATFQDGYELDYFTVDGVQISGNTFEIKADTTVGVVAKATQSGPTSEQGTIAPMNPSTGTAAFTPKDATVTAATVNLNGSTCKVSFPKQIKSITGVPADQIVIMSGDYDITEALAFTGDAATGITYALNEDPNAKVAGVPVTPTIAAEDTDFDITGGTMEVKGIAGLYYTLVGADEVTAMAEAAKIGASVQATTTGATVKLADEREEKPVAQFYQVKVTIDEIK